MTAKIAFCQCTHKLEQENTLRTVKRVKPFVDRMVIIEDNLDDNIREELRKEGAEVYTVKWNDYFSGFRNQYIKQVSVDWWIAQCDPDEGFSDELLKNLRDIVEKAESRGAGVVVVPVEDHFYHKDGRYTVDRSNWNKPLIFKRYLNVKYSGQVHETIMSENTKALEAPPNCVYTHTRWWYKVGRAGTRNDFIAESNRESKDYWVPMRRMFNKYGIKNWYQLENYYTKGNIAPEIKEWIIKGKDTSTEYKDHFIWYFEYLHPEELPDDIKQNHKSQAM